VVVKKTDELVQAETSQSVKEFQETLLRQLFEAGLDQGE
jgi:hypothetical protein